MAKSKKGKSLLEPQQQQDTQELKSKVLVKDKKFVTIKVGDEDTVASMQIYYVLECIYEKSSKRASWENFFKKWRPTVLKMEGEHVSAIEKEILGK